MNHFKMSKALSEQIAQSLTEKKSKAITALQLNLSEYVTRLAMFKVPEPVLSVFKSHCEYIETARQAYLDGDGFNREIISLTKQVPHTGGSNIHLKLSAAERKTIRHDLDNILKLKAELKELKTSISASLYNLSTFKNIQEQFPEAIPHLPKSNNSGIMVNLNKIRQAIKA